jgi:hypothetical protein
VQPVAETQGGRATEQGREERQDGEGEAHCVSR